MNTASEPKNPTESTDSIEGSDSYSRKSRRSRRRRKKSRVSRITLSAVCHGFAEFLLLLVVTAAPWCIGGVLPQFKMLAPALVIIAFGCAIVGHLLGHTVSADLITPRQTWLLVAAVVMAVCQVVPLPHAIAQAFSPSASIAHNGVTDFTQSPEYLEQTSASHVSQACLEYQPDQCVEIYSLTVPWNADERSHHDNQ